MKDKKSSSPDSDRGIASNYICPIDDIQPEDSVVICCRVSGRQQRHRGNLRNAERNLRTVVKERGARVVGAVSWVGPGYEPEDWLSEAVTLAKQHDAKLLAETTNRFIRHPDYHSVKRPEAQAREEDLRKLESCADGVTLATVLHPDATWQEERSYHIRRGRRQKKRVGGRPPKATPGEKKRFRKLAQIKTKWMMHAGLSNRRIAKLLKTNESNIRRWGAPFLRGGTLKVVVTPVEVGNYGSHTTKVPQQNH